MIDKSWWRPFRMVWLVGTLGLALSVTLAVWFHREGRRLDQVRFDELSYRLKEDLDTQTEKIEAMLRSLARILSAETVPSDVVWTEFMNQVSPKWNFPGVVGLGYATNHALGQVLTFSEPWLKGSNQPPRDTFFEMEDFRGEPRQWTAWRLEVFQQGMHPALPFRERQTGIHQIDSWFGSRVAVFEAACPFLSGTRIKRDPGVLYRGDHTYQVQDAAARDDVQVKQDLFVLNGTNVPRIPQITMLVATSHPRWREISEAFKGPPRNQQDDAYWFRWQFNSGLVFANLDYQAILAQIQGNAAPQVSVEIYSEQLGKLVTSKHWLNPNTTSGGSPGHHRAFTRWDRWLMYGDTWGLHFYTTPMFDRHSTIYRAWWAGSLGVLVTALFCWVLAVQTRGRLLETRRAAEIQEARNALQAAQKERERLSHDLHDGAIQSLYAIQLGLTKTGRAVEAQAPETAQSLQESRASLDAVIGELREFITEMKRDTTRPAAGLAAALDSLVRRLRPASHSSITLECDPVISDRLTSAQSFQLAAIVREALSNSLRHASATVIEVRLTGTDSAARLEVSDDGTGFDPAQSGRDGFGLKTMRQRAVDLGGLLEIKSAPKQGTRIRVDIPLSLGIEGEADHE